MEKTEREKQPNEVRVKNFEIVQDLDATHWGEIVKSKVRYLIAEYEAEGRFKTEELVSLIRFNIESCLTDKGVKVELIAGRIHDKDTQTYFNAETGEVVTGPKTPHVHIFVSLNKKTPLPGLCNAIGVPEQQIEFLDKGRYGKENKLAYLIHAKDPEKYQYTPEEVATAGTFDYMSYYYQKKEAWEARRATVKRVNVNLPKVDWLVEQVLLGKLTRENILLTDEYFSVYASNKSKVDEAFELFYERKIMKSMHAMKNGEFNLACFYVTGQSGSGKTAFTLDLVDRIRKLRPDWSVYQGASSNPFDDYKGEEIIFLDDLRPSSMGASDWLKLLDPINISPVSARYKNRTPVPRILILTAYMPIDEFFYFVRDKGNNRSEALDQFLRRFAGMVEIIRVGDERFFTFEEIQRLDEPVTLNVLRGYGYGSDPNQITFRRNLGKHPSLANYGREDIELHYHMVPNEATTKLPVKDYLNFFADYIVKKVEASKPLDVTPA